MNSILHLLLFVTVSLNKNGSIKKHASVKYVFISFAYFLQSTKLHFPIVQKRYRKNKNVIPCPVDLVKKGTAASNLLKKNRLLH